MNKYVILAVIGVFVATGCRQSEVETKNEFRQGEPIEVALTLSLEQTQTVARSEPTTTQYSGGGFDAEITTEPIDSPTGKAVDDLAIANVWVLQFDGTTNDAKLIYKSYVENYIAGSTVELLKATADNRVAVVANTFDAAWATSFALHSATWATVSAKSKSVAAQSDVLLPNGGTDYLPMSGTVSGTLSVGATLNVPLIRTVVKVVVQLKSGADLKATAMDVQMCGVPNATAWFPDAAADVWPASPTAIDYGAQSVTGITTTDFVSRTFWVPVNRRGSVLGTTSFVRATNAPVGATYLGVSAGGWAYKVHLGGDFATDYNLRANTAYTYSLVFHTDLTDVDDRVTDVRALGALAQSPGNDLAAAGATVTVSSPNASAGLDWSAALSNTVGFALGSVTGVGSLASVPVTVGLNPTSAVRSSVFTATASNGQSSSVTLRQAASTMGALTQTPTNNILAAGAVVAVTTPKATAGLAWTAALSNTTGFTLGKVSGSGVTGSVSVTVGVNPTNAVRSSTLTATATGGNTAGTVVISQAASSLSYTSLSATTPAARSATSVTFTVTGTAGLTLSFAKSSGDAGFSVPANLTCDGSAQTVTVAMAANTGADREAVYSAMVTNAGASGLNLSGITVKQEADKRRDLGYITKAGDGTGLPVGMMCMGLYGGDYDGSDYTKGLYIDKYGTNTSGINQGTVADGTKQWGNATATDVRDQYHGLANTNKLTNSAAANYCRNKGTGWYLPAYRQLKRMQSVHLGSYFKGTNYAFTAGAYWSSTEKSAANADYVSFATVYDGSSAKSTEYYVRCVREY